MGERILWRWFGAQRGAPTEEEEKVASPTIRRAGWRATSGAWNSTRQMEHLGGLYSRLILEHRRASLGRARASVTRCSYERHQEPVHRLRFAGHRLVHGAISGMRGHRAQHLSVTSALATRAFNSYENDLSEFETWNEDRGLVAGAFNQLEPLIG